MRTRAVILRNRGLKPAGRNTLFFLGVGLVVTILIMADVTMMVIARRNVPQPVVVEQTVATPAPDDSTSEHDPLWDPDRMGKILKRELDKVEAAK